MWQELEGSLAPDAYWRQTTWQRLVAIAAGPAVNLVFAFVLFAVLFMVASTRDTNVIGRVVSGTPAAASGLRAGDRVLRVAGVPVAPKEIPAHIHATGRPAVPAARPARRKARVDRPAAREADAGRLPDRDRDRVAHRPRGVAPGGSRRFRRG